MSGDDEQIMTCHSCGVENRLVVTATVPQSQVLTMKLTSDSKWFGADTIGQMLVSQADVLKNVARCLGTEVCVFITAVKLVEHEIEITFAITAVGYAESRNEQ